MNTTNTTMNTNTSSIIIKMIRNDEDGLTVEVSKGSGRYCVRMRDDDSGNWLPIARVYSTEADALAYAQKISGLDQ